MPLASRERAGLKQLVLKIWRSWAGIGLKDPHKQEKEEWLGSDGRIRVKVKVSKHVIYLYRLNMF